MDDRFRLAPPLACMVLALMLGGCSRHVYRDIVRAELPAYPTADVVGVVLADGTTVPCAHGILSRTSDSTAMVRGILPDGTAVTYSQAEVAALTIRRDEVSFAGWAIGLTLPFAILSVIATIVGPL